VSNICPHCGKVMRPPARRRYLLSSVNSGGTTIVDRNTKLESSRYTHDDAEALRDWLNDRADGYPSLSKFKSGRNWPHGATWTRDRYEY
jgi:hypothetical protein